jgi:poly(A) polymerase
MRLRDAGHIAYFAGGCVRDTLLGLAAADWDVATDAPPPRIRQLFINTQAVGAAFGVILVRSGRSVVEVATFRADGVYEDGRRPSSVRFTSAEEDARRRDFTINGMFFDPVNDQVIDFVGGREDLAAGRIRAIGNAAERFAEDHLRLLRAVRFAARFNFQIEPGTSAAIRQLAGRLKGISPERVGDELRLMLTAASFPAAWQLLWNLGLAGEIFRFLPKLPPLLDMNRSILLNLSEGAEISFGLALAGAVLCVQVQADPVSDITPLLSHAKIMAATRALRQALRISNTESDEMSGTLAGLLPLLQSAPPTLAMKKRFLAQPTAGQSRKLLGALARTGYHVPRIAALTAELAELANEEVAPAPLITGDDLIALGLSPGPRFRKILEAVYDAQLEDRVKSRDEAIEFVRAKSGE